MIIDKHIERINSKQQAIELRLILNDARVDFKDFYPINNKNIKFTDLEFTDLEFTDLEYTKITSLRFQILGILQLLAIIDRRTPWNNEMYEDDMRKQLYNLIFMFTNLLICVDKLLESHKKRR